MNRELERCRASIPLILKSSLQRPSRGAVTFPAHYTTEIVGVRGENSASRGAGTGRQAQLPAPDGNQLDPPPESAG